MLSSLSTLIVALHSTSLVAVTGFTLRANGNFLAVGEPNWVVKIYNPNGPPDYRNHVYPQQRAVNFLNALDRREKQAIVIANYSLNGDHPFDIALGPNVAGTGGNKYSYPHIHVGPEYVGFTESFEYKHKGLKANEEFDAANMNRVCGRFSAACEKAKRTPQFLSGSLKIFRQYLVAYRRTADQGVHSNAFKNAWKKCGGDNEGLFQLRRENPRG